MRFQVVAMLLLAVLAMYGCQAMSIRAAAYPTEATVDSIETGTSKQQVHSLLGPPDSIDVFHRLNQEVWRYVDLLLGADEIWVTFSLDGVVTQVQRVPYIEYNDLLFD